MERIRREFEKVRIIIFWCYLETRWPHNSSDYVFFFKIEKVDRELDSGFIRARALEISKSDNFQHKTLSHFYIIRCSSQHLISTLLFKKKKIHFPIYSPPLISTHYANITLVISSPRAANALSCTTEKKEKNRKIRTKERVARVLEY